jgi:hypothetical protein
MATRAGRVVCPRCGANNFDTVSACWKCSAPLGAGAAGMAAPAPAIPVAPAAPMPAYATAPSYAAPAAAPEYASYRPIPAAVSTGNPALSNRSAFWLGMLMPYFGFPIGLAFMMCDDQRRQEVGRICVFWSIVSGVIHLLLMFVSLLGMRQYFGFLMQTLQSTIKNSGGGMGGGLGGEM